VTTELQQNRYDQLVRRVGGIIGPGSKVAEALSELFPVLDLENMPSELLVLGGTRIVFGGGTVTGVAGQAPKMGLFNPANSGNIVILTAVVYSTLSTGTVRWGLNTNELATQIGTEVFADSRLGFTARPVGRIGTESAVALANATGQSRVVGNARFDLQFPNDLCVLAPGFGFEIGSNVNASIILTAFYWRERAAIPSELNLA